MAKRPTVRPGFEGFTRADNSTKQRIIGLSYGEPGSRKTSFWLEAPGPIAIFGWDQGLEGTVKRILDESPDKEIYTREFEWFPKPDDGPDDLQARAKEVLDEFEELYGRMLTTARTVVLDNETDLCNLSCYAEWGHYKGDNQRDFDKVNARMRRIINLAKSKDVNLGSEIDIYGDNIAIISMPRNNEHGIIIRSASVAEGFRSLFNFFWESLR